MSNFRITTGQTLEAMELTSQLKRLVPNVSGVNVIDSGLDIRPITGDFTLAEQGLLRAVVASHDAASIGQIRSAREQAIRDERAKKPATLTLPERLHRIELFLGLD